MKSKHIRKVLLLVAITILLVGLASAATTNKTNTNKDTKVIKDNTKSIKTTPATTKKASTKIVTNNKTQINKIKEKSSEKVAQKIEKNKQKNTKTETEQEVSRWEDLQNIIGQANTDTTIKLQKELITTDTITWGKPYTLTIDGNGQTINGNQKQVFRIEEGSTLHLKNITITNATTTGTGTGEDAYAYAYGGAIYNCGTLTINNSTLTNNTANATATATGEHSNALSYAYGGAIYNNMGNLTITNSTLTNNTANATATATATYANADADGGAIFNLRGTLTITHSTFTNNKVNATGTGEDAYAHAHGGAIYNYGGTLSINNFTLTNNTATATGTGEDVYVEAFGGAIYNVGGTLTINNSTFTNNKATATGTGTGEDVYVNACGGAIHNANVNYNYNITDTTFYNNTPVNFNINSDKIQPINNDNYISIGKFTIVADGKEIGNGTGEDLESFTISDEYRNVEIIINGTDGKTLNNRYMLRGFSIDVHNYTELLEAIEKAQSENYDSFLINLKEGDYNATNNINWTESETKYLFINGNNITLDGKHEHQFIRIGSGLTLTLNNITITNYYVTATEENDQAYARGGAIYNNGNLTINNSALTNNTANATTTGTDANVNAIGGAIYNSGTLNITNSTLTNNIATTTGDDADAYAYAEGGAIYNSGTLNITNSTLTNNIANATTTGTNAGANAYGGAICKNGGTLTITNSALTNNIANATATGTGEDIYVDAFGGAIFNSGRIVNITHSILTNNQATATGEYADVNAIGGAIENQFGILNIIHSTLRNNTANATATGQFADVNAIGGAIENNMGTLNITNTTFTNNQATASTTIGGGAIHNIGNNYNITDTTFYKNTPTTFKINNRNKIELVNEDGYISIVKFSIIADGEEIGNDTKYTSIGDCPIPIESNNVEIIINGTDEKTLNNVYILRRSNVEVHNYTELVDAIETAKNEKYNSYIINLKEGNYNATTSINWEESATKNLIINGNGLTLDGKHEYQFIRIGSGLNLTLNNITITNYTAKNGGAVESYGNLTILNSKLTYNTATERGGAIYVQGTEDAQVLCEIVANHFECNRAKEETLYLLNTVTITIKDNSYKNTTIGYDFVLTIDSTKTQFLSTESLPLKYTVSLVHPTFYDENLLDNIDKLTYEITIENAEKLNVTGLLANIELKNYKGKYTANVYNEIFESSNDVNFTVMIPTSIIMKVVNNTLGNVIINVDVKDINNEYVTSGVLKVYNNDKEIASIQLKGKSENITLNIDKGEQKLKLEYKANSNDYYSNSTLTDKVTIISASSITLTTSDVYVGDSVVINGTLKDAKGRGLNTNITVTIKNKKETVTVTDGEFQVIYTATQKETVHIIAEFPGDKYNLESNTTGTFNVQKIDTQLRLAQVKNIYVGDKFILNITLTDVNGNKLANKTVQVQINDESTTFTTDKNGNIVYTENWKDAGTFKITISFDGDDKYNPADNVTQTFKVEKIKTILKIKNHKIQNRDKVKLVATVKNQNNKKVNTGKVIFKLNGITIKDKNGKVITAKVSKGQATITFTPNKNYYNKVSNITAVYSENNKYQRSQSKIAKLTLTKRDAKIKLQTTNIKAIKYDTITVKTLVKDKNKKAIKEGYVIFKINNKTLTKNNKTIKAKIKNGKATLKYNLNGHKTGKYTLTAVLSSTPYKKVTTKTTLKITQDKIHIQAKPIKTSTNKTRIKAKILDTNNKYIKTTIKVSFKIDQKTVAKQVKVKNGKINVKIPTNVTKGKHTLNIVAGPNYRYKVTRKNVSLIKT